MLFASCLAIPEQKWHACVRACTHAHHACVQVVGNMSAEQMYEILGQLKTICTQVLMQKIHARYAHTAAHAHAYIHERRTPDTCAGALCCLCCLRMRTQMPTLSCAHADASDAPDNPDDIRTGRVPACRIAIRRESSSRRTRTLGSQ